MKFKPEEYAAAGNEAEDNVGFLEGIYELEPHAENLSELEAARIRLSALRIASRATEEGIAKVIAWEEYQDSNIRESQLSMAAAILKHLSED